MHQLDAVKQKLVQQRLEKDRKYAVEVAPPVVAVVLPVTAGAFLRLLSLVP